MKANAAQPGATVRRPSEEDRDSRASDGWDLLLGCVAAFTVLAVARVHLLFPALDVVRPVLVFGALSVGLYLVSRHPARKFSLLIVGPVLLLLGFLGWMVMGTPFALRQGATFYFIMESFTRTVALFLVVAGAVRSFRDVERLTWFYFAGAVLYAAVLLVRFEVGEEATRLSDLYTYDANDFALLAVTAMPLGLYFLFRSGRSPLARTFDAAGLTVLLIAFVWSGSRGGFLALLAAYLLFLLRFRGLPARWRVVGATVAAVVVTAVAGPQYWDRMGTMMSPLEDYNVTSPTGRMEIWDRGVGYMLDNPVFGVGAANFAAAEGILSPRAHLQELGIGIRRSAPHNSFLQVGAEMGFPGFFLFMAFLVSIFWTLLRVEGPRRGRSPPTALPRRAVLSEALVVSLAGFMVGAFFLSLAYSSMLYMLAALAVGLGKVSGAYTWSSGSASAHRPRWGGRAAGQLWSGADRTAT